MAQYLRTGVFPWQTTDPPLPVMARTGLDTITGLPMWVGSRRCHALTGRETRVDSSKSEIPSCNQTYGHGLCAENRCLRGRDIDIHRRLRGDDLVGL